MSNCSEQLRAEGKVYPRTCEVCGLGPCKQTVPSSDYISVQEAWEAAGGNPGIKATKEDLIIALRFLDQIGDEYHGALSKP